MYIKNLFNKFFVLFTTLILIAGMCPFSALAGEEAEHAGERETPASIQVRLIVENNVWRENEGAPWSGTLADTYIEIDENDTLASAVSDKLMSMGKSVSGMKTGESICIGDIEDGGAGEDCKWKWSINGVEGNRSLSAYNCKDGSLKDGDTVKLGYDGTPNPEEYADEENGKQTDSGENAGNVSEENIISNDESKEEETVNDEISDDEASDTPVSDTAVFENTENSRFSPESDTAASDSENPQGVSIRNIVQNRASLKKIDAAYENTGDKITSIGIPTVSDTVEEWSAIGLARSESLSEMASEGYYLNVVNYISDNVDEQGKLNESGPVDNAKIILSLTSIGKSVENVNGSNLLQCLADMNYVKKQGVSGAAWTLIALNSNNYKIPKAVGGAEQTTRDKLIACIRSAQLDDGGWSIGSGETGISDSSATAVALQALAPYYNTNSKARPTVNRGLEFLSLQQDEKGRFLSDGTASAKACAQVIIALTSLGIDPEKDSRFIKNGKSAIDGLLSFYDNNGGFADTEDSTEADTAATETAYAALTAYKRFIGGKTSLYDMTDIFKTDSKEETGEKSEKIEKEETSGKKENKTIRKPAAVTRVITKSISLKLGGDVKKAAEMIDRLLNPVGKTERLPEDFTKLTKKQYNAIIEAYKEYTLLSDDSKLLIKNREEFEKVLQKLGEVLHCDEATGIKAEDIDWKYKLIIKEKENFSEELTGIRETLGSEAEVLAFYDIYFIDVTTSEKYNPQKPVTVKIPEPDLKGFDSAVVLHVTEDGKHEYIKCISEEDYLVFKAQKFSPYGIIGIPGSWNDVLHEEKTGTVSWLWLCLGVVAAALLLILIVIRKRQS